mgnify:FL=1
MEFSNGEILQTGFYTGKRDPAQYLAIAEETEDFLQAIGPSATLADRLLAGWTNLTIFIDEWENPIFTSVGWGNAYAYQSPETGQVDALPWQISAVVSLSTNDSELPVRRRRNRSYLGPVALSAMGTTATMNTGVRDATATAVQVFAQTLEGIPVASSTPVEYGGLCTVSYAGTGLPGLPQQIAAATQLRVGRVFDTQRRRSNGLQEEYATLPLTPPV